ncbi:tryptophan halogenase family protein [Aurantiacibacter aquimixticola]|uniref:Tryptophan 7-halogenase n=1 Tax=Aurantiacibacter aquimixticola TaxID=1958945 RepID=A0A419RQS8_9SPHN|nr:tryptophan halogenase family protein [Aurantiacibacter aquimixticola]RJY08126.1 tryptophan 7-halogenase [Aurantiacibacter aquimixticola]
MTEATPPHIVVLGGGSAGWITACLLHHRWRARGGRVTVVESPDIGIIGVGEGSTPQLKAMFDHLGIAEAEWMAACDATYKLGIRFTGWSEREGFDSYFHPFPGPVDLHSEPSFTHNCMLARRGFTVPAHPDDWFLATTLAETGRAPHPGENFPFAPSYGYHFDAYKLGAFLRDWAVARGVEHLSLKVEQVELAGVGEVAALLCEGGKRVNGDLFVDCSGFRALIAGEALGGEFLSFAANLFADRAVVAPTPRVETFRPQTEAVAMSNGWRWRIPLTTRTGNGYVYSSRYISDEDAAAELFAAVGLSPDEVAPRFLQMKVGRMANSWRGNCLAAGLAQGFIEPLEATALHIVIATALEFAEAFEQGGYTPQHRDTFNRNIAARYEAIRDYIVGHYRLNQRSDTQFWRDNAANQNLSDGLKAMFTAWFTHQDIADANAKNYKVQAYAPMSWHALFAGYGTFPPPTKMQPLPPGGSAADPAITQQMLAACATNFPKVDW